MNQATTKTNQKTLFYFLTCALIWGLTWIAIKYQIPYTDGSVAVFYRFVFSSIIMLIVCLVTKTHLKYTAATHLRFLMQGLFMFSCNFLLTYWASSMASSALIALTYEVLQWKHAMVAQNQGIQLTSHPLTRYSSRMQPGSHSETLRLRANSVLSHSHRLNS